MKSLVFSLLVSACGSQQGPNLPKEDAVLFNNNWIESYKSEIPERAASALRILIDHASVSTPASTKIAENLSFVVSIKEVDSFAEKNRLGTCYTMDGLPNNIEVLNKSGLESHNVTFFGIESSDTTLDFLAEFLWLHEFGHCLGGLGHSSDQGTLIMNTYITKEGVSTFMEEPERYIIDLVASIERGSAGLWAGDMDDIITLDQKGE